MLCNGSMAGCVTCLNESVCSSCETGYYLDANTAQCVLCSSAITNCIECNSSSYCDACISSDYEFEPISNQCVSVDSQRCGDGIVQSTEECDDGNADDKDGCFNCYVEADWMCNNTAVSGPSVCSYVGKLELTPETIIKVEGENAVKVVFKL